MEPCAQCRIEIAAGERAERDPECWACADDDGDDRVILLEPESSPLAGLDLPRAPEGSRRFEWMTDERIPRDVEADTEKLLALIAERARNN